MAFMVFILRVVPKRKTLLYYMKVNKIYIIPIVGQ